MKKAKDSVLVTLMIFACFVCAIIAFIQYEPAQPKPAFDEMSRLACNPASKTGKVIQRPFKTKHRLWFVGVEIDQNGRKETVIAIAPDPSLIYLGVEVSLEKWSLVHTNQPADTIYVAEPTAMAGDTSSGNEYAGYACEDMPYLMTVEVYETGSSADHRLDDDLVPYTGLHSHDGDMSFHMSLWSDPWAEYDRIFRQIRQRYFESLWNPAKVLLVRKKQSRLNHALELTLALPAYPHNGLERWEPMNPFSPLRSPKEK